MRVVLINGSPKKEGSASSQIIGRIRDQIGNEAAVQAVRADTVPDASIAQADSIVFVFPLYADSIPAYLLSYMERLEEIFAQSEKKPRIYAALNCGFYEPSQCHIALAMMRRYCDKNALAWGQGVAIGGGGMIAGMELGKGPLTTAGQALDVLCVNLLLGNSGDDELAKPNFPRFMYKAAGNYGWKADAKKHGLKKQDLYAKIPFKR